MSKIFSLIGIVKRNLYGEIYRLCCLGESFELVCYFYKSLYGFIQSCRTCFYKFNIIVQQFAITCSKVNHSIFYCHLNVECIYLIVYVGNIVPTCNDY